MPEAVITVEKLRKRYRIRHQARRHRYSTLRDVLAEKWRLLYSLNPRVGVIDGFRCGLLRGQTPLEWTSVLLSCGLVVLLSLSGIRHFRKMERAFADAT